MSVRFLTNQFEYTIIQWIIKKRQFNKNIVFVNIKKKTPL